MIAPGALKAIQSSLPVASGSRGRGRAVAQQSNPPSPQAGRGSTNVRGRGARGAIRGGPQPPQAQNAQQGQGLNAYVGRGGMNVQARQFVPQGNKRAREDGADGGNDAGGKRIRGGAQNRGS